MSQQQHIDPLDDRSPGRQPGELDRREAWWAERQEALEAAGYMLRSRYHPGWIPSWRGTDKFYLDVEDGQIIRMRLGMDATRISDGRPVVLKRLLAEEGPYELRINKLFSTEPLASDPRNHCVRLLDVIQLPGDPPILVHPMLRRHYDPPFRTIGEFVTFFAQICEGVKFMHENHVAHRDCTSENIMLDPSGMYPKSFHPADPRKSKDFRQKVKGYSRTRRPTRYLLIDFGLSRHYDPAKGPPLDKPLRGGDKSAPEHRDRETPRDPFPTDVYYLGNLVREDYMERYHGLEFMQPLIADMVQEDPTKRPNMDEVVTRFPEIRNKLSTWKLRSRMARNTELRPVAAWRSVAHWFRTIGYVLANKAPIPEPK
ncbi:kinase-like domain-containing protein [Lactarius pseudohatsudake]|nr:kinase-like domain-containing protein [Lactarius pseudohatsudake]